ncbi:MAG: alternative oxidase [Acidimicrobiales bacterium]
MKRSSPDVVGPVTRKLADRPPIGPLDPREHEDLVALQAKELSSPRRSYSAAARLLFAIMDLVYGQARTLQKFRVLEVVARVPYQAWESVAYVALTHTSRNTDFARRVYDRARAARIEQDNEQWHLLILEELTAGRRRSLIRGRLIPQILALGYYQVSWILYAIRPKWSYRLNADFEDHAAHEYALFVEEHPEWEDRPFTSDLESDFGSYRSLADVLRQIGYDEQLHREESEAMMRSPRFN